MIVGYGRTCPKGRLPVYSVQTEEEAETLIARTCELVFIRGKSPTTGYVAPELEVNQTLENLYKFRDRLHEEYQKMIKEKE